MAQPFFSIIVPTYNRSSTINETLRSVRSQTFSDFECIIVDDGSKDGDKLASAVSELNDSRFRVVRRANGGGGAARNTGIDAAAGRYIAFLDSDDRFLSTKLEQARDAIFSAQQPSQLVFFSQIIVDRGVGKTWIKPPRPPFSDEPIDEYLILRHGFIQTSTIVLDRAAASQVRFDETLFFGQDTDFCIRLAASGYRFHMLPQPSVIWRDDALINRVSSNGRHEQILAWTDKLSKHMTRRSYLAYRGWHGAKAAKSSAYSLALKLYFSALVSGAFPPKLAAQAALQVFLKPENYRSLANLVVRVFGTSRESK